MLEIKDYGPNPAVLPLERMAALNRDFRVALWTGNHLQVTLMCIPAGSEIGREKHENLDQMLKIVSGYAFVELRGEKQMARAGDAVFVPAGTVHNVINAGRMPLRLYSVYAPVQHPFGTRQKSRNNVEPPEKG